MERGEDEGGRVNGLPIRRAEGSMDGIPGMVGSPLGGLKRRLGGNGSLFDNRGLKGGMVLGRLVGSLFGKFVGKLGGSLFGIFDWLSRF